MAIVYKDINQLTQKSSVAGTEKIEVSDTEYITPSQIAGKAGTKVYEYSVTSFDSASITSALPNNFYLTLKADIDNGLVPIIKLISTSNDEVALVFDMYYGTQKNIVFSSADKYYVCTLLVEYNKGSYNKYTYSEIQPQEKLVSGTNIKTINNQSLLGSGNITISGGGGGDTSDCVHKTGDETVGGDKTFTDDIVVGDASNIKYGASSGSGFTRGYASVVCDDADYIKFTGITEAPAAFIVTLDLSGDSSDTGFIAVIGDSTGTHAVYSADSTHQNNYTDACDTYISNGFTISAGDTGFISGATYKIVYYAGSGTLSFRTATVSPGSGATSVTFTDANLTAVPAFYATMLESQVNNESYRRVAYYTNEGGGSAATPMGVSFYSSQIHNTTSNFSVSYNNGLVINSGGTNAGGYFHNPGTYTLYYLMASDIGGGSGSYSDLADELSDIKSDITALETGKQDTLVSGTSIKTINSTSLLGSGNIAISSLPAVTATNNGQLLEVSNGAWAAGRTITISSSEPTAYQGNNGDIWIVI